MAYQGLGQYDDALIAFSEGLAVDPKQSSSLVGLIDAMLKSPLKGNGMCVFMCVFCLRFDPIHCQQ